MNPKVFLSHASEDKPRFVLDFATRLRLKGIDVWLDKWEMLPGDSLVDKIFEEGLKDAQAVIVVISQFSVNKPWVREELNASMVRKINGASKLIPVVIDPCDVPECLKATVWESIKDLGNYDAEFHRILNAILDHREKPPLGPLPAYTRTNIENLSGLTEIDSLVMKLACEEVLGGHPNNLRDTKPLVEQCAQQGIAQSDVKESLQILVERGYLKLHGLQADDLEHAVHTVTDYGFGEYARTYVPDYPGLMRAVALKIVNEELRDDASIGTSLGQPRLLIDHILERFTQQGLIKPLKPLGGGYFITQVSPELKRRLQRDDV
jgi:hypothetical protein